MLTRSIKQYNLLEISDTEYGHGLSKTDVKIFAQLSIIIFWCCGLTVIAAMLMGRGGGGLSVGYQVADNICTIQLIDTVRPAASFALVRQRPFCLLNSAWSPNRHYAAIRDFSTGALSIATGQTKNEWRTTFDIKGVTVLQGSPSWSADSQQLAFLTDNSDATVIGTLRMENDIPGKPRLFTVEAAYPIGYSPPVWSPDGQFLAFGAYASSRGQSRQELYILNVSSGEIHRLTTNSYRDDSPSWSPDGSELVFTSAEDGYNELYIINVATGERRRLTYFIFGYLPSWSPDGKSIMFMSNMDHNNDLYVINTDGTGVRRLTTNHYTDSVFPIWPFPS